MDRFYIRRFECWGGSYKFAVAERSTRRTVSPMMSEPAAKRLLERIESDWHRYECAMLDGGRFVRSLPEMVTCRMP